MIAHAAQQIYRIVLTGPESTGKTTLLTQIQAHYNCLAVAEEARRIIGELDRPYTQVDLLVIAQAQRALENKILTQAAYQTTAPFVICDTDLRTIRIWSNWKYGSCDEYITAEIAKATHTFYLLCSPDIPHQPDPQRENPNDLIQLFNLYEQDLRRDEQRYYWVEGSAERRLDVALFIIELFKAEMI